MKVAKRPLYSIFLFSSFFSALFLRMTHCDLTDGQGRCKRSERRRGGGLLTAAEYKKWLSYVIRLRVELLRKRNCLFFSSAFFVIENHVSFGLESRRGLNGKMRLSLLWRKNVSFSMWFVFIVSYDDEHTFIVAALSLVKAIKRP